MKITALSAFTAFDGEMKVFNVGDTDELRDDLAQGYVDAGKAKRVGGADSPSGSKPSADDAGAASSDAAELGEARKAYRALFGKNAGPKWSVAEIAAKIAEKPSADDAGAAYGDGQANGDNEAPPAE